MILIFTEGEVDGIESRLAIFLKIFSTLLKVSKPQKQFFLKLHCPKSNLNFLQISALAFKMGQKKIKHFRKKVLN